MHAAIQRAKFGLAAAAGSLGAYVSSQKDNRRHNNYVLCDGPPRLANVAKNGCTPFPPKKEPEPFCTLGVSKDRTAVPRQFTPTEVKDTGCTFNDKVNPSPYSDSSILPEPNWRPLPTFSLKEVKAHGTMKPDETWVTYRGGVYDMTTFAECHPGGEARVHMVQGQDLEAFWEVYSLHNRPHIQNLIQHYRIGNLSKEESEQATRESTFSNYYDNDPVRLASAREGTNIPSTHPWNHEPSREALVESFYTPNELFFVRNHNNVPDLKPDEWELEIEENPDCGIKAVSFTLEDLKTKFPRHEVVAALQCAGNRQEDFVTEDRPLYVAPHWTGGAIGCAKWAGVKVRDLLRHAGLDVDEFALGNKEYPNAKICNFIAEDMDETGTPYAGVLPIEKVTDPFGDTILAYEMNGQTLPRDHGYPVRLLAPGHAGCRNVKWVKNIIVSKAVSSLDSGSKLDRHFNPSVSFMNHLRFGDDHVRLELGPVIQTMPVTSIICIPGKNANVEVNGDGKIEVRGVAYSGGGRGICRVEVSVDGGNQFHPCELWGMRPKIAAEWGQGRNWAWVQFEQKVSLPEDVKKQLKKNGNVGLEIVCRAIDGDFNSQPEKMEHSYNSLGICINHWDKLKVNLVDGETKNKAEYVF